MANARPTTSSAGNEQRRRVHINGIIRRNIGFYDTNLSEKDSATSNCTSMSGSDPVLILMVV